MGKPSSLYNKWVTAFEANKKPYKEYNAYDEKEYVREHNYDWEDNFWASIKQNPVYLDREEHAERIDEYQKFKAEEAGELDNPHWWVESSDVLRLFDSIKELTKELQSPKVEKDLGTINFLLGDLLKILKNRDVSGWFYTPNGFVDFLFFLDYGLKNYYE